MQNVVCIKCGSEAKCLRKEQLTQHAVQPGQRMSEHASIGWRYYLDCPKCGNHIQEELHNSPSKLPTS
jgi:hypothetical protein